MLRTVNGSPRPHIHPHCAAIISLCRLILVSGLIVVGGPISSPHIHPHCAAIISLCGLILVSGLIVVGGPISSSASAAEASSSRHEHVVSHVT